MSGFNEPESVKIFRSEKTGIKEEYLDLLQWLYNGDKESYKSYNRLYIRDVKWIVNGFFNGDENLDLDFFGYSPSKLTLLKRNYENLISLVEANKILVRQLDKKKDYVSAAFSFMTGNKTERLKSYCMTSAVLIKDPCRTDINIFYRVTEVTKKFGADLVFLKYLFTKYIPPKLIDQIDTVNFNFSLIYVVPIYFPLAYMFGIEIPDEGNWFHRSCWQQLGKAKDLSFKPKYSQTDRVFRTFRQWYFKEGENVS